MLAALLRNDTSAMPQPALFTAEGGDGDGVAAALPTAARGAAEGPGAGEGEAEEERRLQQQILFWTMGGSSAAGSSGGGGTSAAGVPSRGAGSVDGEEAAEKLPARSGGGRALRLFEGFGVGSAGAPAPAADALREDSSEAEAIDEVRVILWQLFS